MRRLAWVVAVLVGCAGSPPRPVEPPEHLEQPTSAPSAGATPLKTRAHPLARYLVRVHTELHERWGAGFLRSLEGKPAGDPLNDAKLATTLEIVIATDGGLDRGPRVIQSSGLPAFDRAAQEAFVTAAPFAAPPAEIRSYDGNVHLRWTLHRDERQCSASFADPIILDAPP